jgi:hypothetical protein
VKNFFTETKFRNDPAIPVFQKAPFKKLTDKLTGMFRESNRAVGKVETEDVSSTRRDREAIATACLWMNSPEFAEFWHLSNSSYHCCGRGSETSLIKADGVVSLEINEMVYRYDILAVQLQRQKNGPFQTLPIYPHRDGLLQDFYFSLIHLIIVKGCDHEYVLPQFSSAALKTKKSGKSSSDVSRQWTKFFEGIRSTFEVLADEINEELSSHSNRRGGNQSLAENPSVHGFAAIYRSGIKPKNLATIFDLFGSLELLRQSGKGLAGWVTKNGEHVMGGQPVTFDDITEDVDVLRKFTNAIFENDTEGRWHPKVRELLVMTLLLRYDQFIDILHSHPFTKLVETHPDADADERYSCSSVEDNIFVNRIDQLLERVCDDNQNDELLMDLNPSIRYVSNRMFTRWRTEAREAFVSRNQGGLPISVWHSYGVNPATSGVLMDTRTVIDHFNLLASVVQANHMELQRLKYSMNDLRQAFSVESKITSTHVVERLFNMERSLRRLEENLLPEAPKPETSPSKGVLFFSVSSKCLSTSASLSEVTTAFFVDDYRTGYTLETKSPAWNERDSNQEETPEPVLPDQAHRPTGVDACRLFPLVVHQPGSVQERRFRHSPCG